MAKSQRQCGACSLCCKVMAVPEVKADHEWCPHAKPGHGCGIYPRRPEKCREFHCMWLIDNKFPDYWFPAKSKIVVNTSVDGVVSFIVDPAYPLRWMEEPWFGDIKHIARAGVAGRLGKRWVTMVLVGKEKIPIIGTPRLLHAAG